MSGLPIAQGGSEICGGGAGALLGPIAVVGALVLIFRIMLRGRIGGFSRERAATQFRSLTGENASLVLSTVVLARLLFNIAKRGGTDLPHSCSFVSLIGIATVILLLGLVVAERFTRAMLGFGGLAAFLVFTFSEEGWELGTYFLILAWFLLVVLTVLRGFIRRA